MKKAFKYIGIVVAAILVLVVAFFAAFDWNWLRGYLNDRLADIGGRAMVVQGDIDVDPGWTSRITLEDIRFDNADWSDRSDMARIGRAEIDLEVMSLLEEAPVIPRLFLKDPWLMLETSAEGRHNWDLSPEEKAPADEGTGGSPPPLIESLVVEGGEIRYVDHGGGADLQGTIETRPGDEGEHRLVIEAGGDLFHQALSFRFTGDPLTDLQEPGITYAAHLTAGMGETHGEAEGVIHQPLRFKGIDASVKLTGPDVSRLAPLWGGELPETPEYLLDCHLVLEEGVWRLREIDADLGKSRFAGSVTVDPGGDRPRIEADLHSGTLDPGGLLVSADDGDVEDEETASGASGPDSGADGAASFLTAVDADITYRADEIRLPEFPLDSGGFHLRLAEGRLRVDPLELTVAGGSVTASATLREAGRAVKGSATARFEDIDLSRLDLGGPDSGIVSGRLVLDLPPVEEMDRILAALTIEESRLRFRDPAADTDLVADIRAGEGEGGPLRASVSGQYGGRSVDLSVTGDPLGRLMDSQTPYDLSIDGTVNEQPFRMAADIAQGDGSIGLQNLDTRLAGSDLSGEIRWETAGDRPKLVADLEAGTLDPERLRAFVEAVTAGGRTSGEDPGTDEAEAAAAGPLDLGMLSGFDAEIVLDADRLRLPDRTLENLHLDLALREGRLAARPLRFTLYGGIIAADMALDVESSPLSGIVRIRLQELEMAQVLAAVTKAEPDLGTLEGTLDLRITEAGPGDLDRDILLPQVGRLTVEEGRLTYRHPPEESRVTLSIRTQAGAGGNPILRVTGEGRYDGKPFHLSFSGDPLLDMREPDDPYFLDLEMSAADTRADISGQVRRIFDLQGLDLSLEIAGPNPARLYPLIGVSLPDLPPYDLKGQLSLADGVWRFQDFEGRVGDSDLSGHLRVSTAGEKPSLTADLSSSFLDFDDLAGLVGAAPDTGPEETASPAQRREDVREERDEDALPEEPYAMARLRAMDAAVRYGARRVMARDLPLDQLVIDFDLQNGQMTFSPLKFNIGGGSVETKLTVEPRDADLEGSVEAEIRRIDLKRVFRGFDMADESVGIIGGRAKYWFRGVSVADFLASADGGIYLLMTGGRLDSLLLEALGLDAGEAIIAYFQESQSVRIDCGYADLHSKSGVTTLETVLVDTIDTLLMLSGTIRFGSETLDLVIHPHAKDPSLFSARTPLHITGSFSDPEIFPDESALAARGAAALGLGLAAGPAAILPFIETGTGDEARLCQGLIESIEEAR